LAKGTRLQLTAGAVRVTAAGAQELRLAREVLAFDQLDVVVRVLSLEGGGASIDLALQTGMQLESAQGWVTLGAFNRITSSPSGQSHHFTGLLRYVRYEVTALAGTAATFTLCATGRSWAS